MARTRHTQPPAPVAPLIATATVEDRLARHHRAILLSIIALSLLIRLICLIQLRDNPCTWQHRWTQTDMAFFDQWARTIIADGDWLTDRSLHPYHGWHREVAQAYFRAHPDIEAALRSTPQPPGTQLDPARLLWQQWYGGKQFHQEPLYPYMLVATYALIGDDPRCVFAIQMAFGVLTNVLLYLLVRRCFGHLAAVLAAAIAILYAPLLYAEFLLLRESLLAFTTVALLYLTTLCLQWPHLRWWFITGLALGLAILLKSTFAAYGLILLLALFCLPAGPWPHRLRQGGTRAALLTAGALLALSPAFLRNLIVGAPTFSLSSVAAVTFVASNVPDNQQVAGFDVGHNVPQIMGASAGRLAPAVIQTLRLQPDSRTYLLTLARKVANIFQSSEAPDNSNFYIYRWYTPILYALPLGMGLLAAPAILGLLLLASRALRPRSPSWPLLAMGAVQLITLLAFGVSGRLRLPIVPILIPLAAAALVWVVQAIQSRHLARAALSLAVVLAIIFWSNWVQVDDAPLIRVADRVAPVIAYYTPSVNEAVTRGDLAQAITLLTEALRYEPDLLLRLDQNHPVHNADEATLVLVYSDLHRRRAQLLRLAGNPTAAADDERRNQQLSAALQPYKAAHLPATAR